MEQLRLTGIICLIFICTFLVPQVQAQDPGEEDVSGEIAGTVMDSDGAPCVSANILVVGEVWGTNSFEDGTYSIKNLPPGIYTIEVRMMSHKTERQTDIIIEAGEITRLSFTLQPEVALTIPTIGVTAKRKKIEKTKSSTSHRIAAEDISELPVDDMEEVIGLQAGVIAQGGQLYFRGGRAGEVQYQVDGVPVRDPLVGGDLSLATLAVADTDVMLGGLDAKYGNAQSGIVLYTTKEGGERFTGEMRYQTDDFGQPNNTYDNWDRLFLGLGGPTPITDLTYYMSAEASYSDAYPKTQERRSRQKLLNFISVGDRKNNQVKIQGKVAYIPSPNHKITFEMLDQTTRSDEYMHNWSRAGYVQEFLDTTQTNDVVLRYGRWSPVQLDSTYHYYNAAEHRPNNLNEFEQYKIVFRHTLSKDALYSLKVSQQHFFQDVRVSGKKEWEYLGERERDFYFNYFDGISEDFYVVSGDFPFLSVRETYVSQGLFDMTVKKGKHTIESGASIAYNDMRNFSVNRPYMVNDQGMIGTPRTSYHYYNPEGALYLQDRWEHEGMVINAGLRYDIFSVGDQLTLSYVQEPVKQQLSPRIGIAYPISDRDVFSFHYGRFYQIPDRIFLFDDLESFDATRGNPNLNNETTVAYQAAIQHLFSELLVGQFSVYYKDIFGQITATQTADFTSTGNVSTYENRDYASSKGFEVSLNRGFDNNMRWDVAYSYGNATGVASDPNAALNRNFTYLPTGEQPLNWDARHSVSTTMFLGDRINWGVTMTWRLTTGTPFTPIQRDTRQTEPNVVNSRRMGATTTLDVRADKYYMLWGKRLSLFIQGRNILDAKNITTLTPGNTPLPPVGSAYTSYYTETGRAGGAYLDDQDGDGLEEYVPLNDPRVFGAPRVVRFGVGYQF